MSENYRKRWQEAKAKAKGVKLPSKDLGGALDAFEDALFQMKLVVDAYLGAKQVIDEKVWKEKSTALNAAFKPLEPLMKTYADAINKEIAALKKLGAKAPHGATVEVCDALMDALGRLLGDVKLAHSKSLANFKKVEELFPRIDHFMDEISTLLPHYRNHLNECLEGKAKWERVVRELSPKVAQLEETPNEAKAGAKALLKSYPETNTPSGLLSLAKGQIDSIDTQRLLVGKYAIAAKLKPSLNMLDSLEKGFQTSIAQNKPLVKPVEDLYKRIGALLK